MAAQPISRPAAPPLWVLTVSGQSGLSVGTLSPRQIPLAEGTITLGGSRACGVVLEGRQIAGQHARLQVSSDGAVLTILPHAEPAVLHGVRVQRAGLASGDSFRLGDLHLTVRRCAEAAAPPRGLPHAVMTDAADEPSAAPLALLEELLAWTLRGAPGERAAMLARFARGLGAASACLFAKPQSGNADAGGRIAYVAAWGEVGAGVPPQELASLVRQSTAAEGTVVCQRGELLAAGIGGLPGGAFGIVLCGPRLVPGAGEALRLAVRLFAHDALREQAAAARSPPPAAGLHFPPDVVVGQSRAARRLYDQLELVARSQLPVLVFGETGVGKEHVARVVHDSSRRRDRPFVTINCAAIPAELLEAELFGIGRGVATGVSERAGKFREAHGGTLFLDEIGELPLSLQAKLLRALEEKKVHPVGGQAAEIDLRIVAASNARLEDAAKSGGFRRDLYYRLAGFLVEVPPLRERSDDIPLLFESFLREVASPPPRLSPRALAALVRHRWDGNVRELRHEAVRVGGQVGAGGEVGVDDLSPAVAASAPPAAAGEAARGGRGGLLDEELARLESSLIDDAVAAAGRNLSAAARRLGISRTRLYRRLGELGRARD